MRRLILTHSNADFDAVASLLAMHKLDPTAQPVLPPRLERNVINFLTLYASLLSAIPFEDVGNFEDVEYIYLVDTQKHPKLPKNVTVHIIDHHPAKGKFPRRYQVFIDEVGSTTTILVERMQHEDIFVSSLEATLMMLGIYSDTGSLTYGTTTPRDIRAAAWLLEHGAKIDLVREFLTLPLVDEQWAVYDTLRESAKIIDVEGYSILVATAKLPAQVTGLATVTHQLANIYDPNALVVIIQVGDDVQLIARSSVDEIDVGIIARQMGGGGHSRAAAALIRKTPLEAIVDQVLPRLNTIVQPSITVTDLMSTGRIETISHSATIAEAANLMQISGHEGYPVLANGKVVGLLTRRAVDRAMSHQLEHQSVEHIMEAATTISVHPKASLEVVRQTMMDTGWGQLPVMDDDGNLIGIVTRTDLIRRWGEKPSNHRRQRLILQQLQQTLSEGLWTLVRTISQEAQSNRMDLYLVGGMVRDLLLNVSNLDIDFVVEGDAIALVKQLCSGFGGDIRYHAQFGTAKWLIDRQVAEALRVEYSSEWPASIDFATARAEFYKAPTALPTVRQSSIKQDLHRRDFTINSMAIRLAPEPMGDLIDFYNGERDLSQKIIRVLHSLSFVDDPTRMIRAVRFEQRFDFTIEPRTENLLVNALSFLDRVTGERIRHELEHIFHEPNPTKALKRLEQLGILRQIFPLLRIDVWFENAYRALANAGDSLNIAVDQQAWDIGIFVLLSLRLLPEELERFAHRLLISQRHLKTLKLAQSGYQRLLTFTPETRPSEIVYVLETLEPICWLVLWAVAPTAQLRESVVNFVSYWRFMKTNYDGNRLRELGITPGPRMGAILKQLRCAWLDGKISTLEEEGQYLRNILETK